MWLLTMMDQHVLFYFKKWRSIRSSVLMTPPPGANLPPTPSSYDEDVCLETHTLQELDAAILGSHNSLGWSIPTRVCSKSNDGVRAYVRY